MKKTRAVPLDSFEAAPPQVRLCEQKGCTATGEFRAPKSPSHLREYYWFCLHHVQQYNKAWDFYKGMSSQEIDASRTSDITWNRPSWPMGGWRAIVDFAYNVEGMESFLSVFSPPKPPVPEPIQKALQVLELDLPLTIETLKKQYKKLAKQYHPDLQAGDKTTEEKLKAVNEAYQMLKKHFFPV